MYFITNQSSPGEKVKLFASLFRGRPDVFPVRFESRKTGKGGYAPACANEWVRGVCEKPRIKCSECPRRRFFPVSEKTITCHLAGSDENGHDFVMGIYPMLADETCWLLAIDFDKENWFADAQACRDTCRRLEIPAALERSRSGRGGHLWLFFEDAVPAALARKLGSFILTETMEHRPDIGLDSYDRMFPNQDTLPKGGFGNLIALPLQKKAREKGNAVFINDAGEPHSDQWKYLSGMARTTRADLDRWTREAERRGRILNVRVPELDPEDNILPWFASSARTSKPAAIAGALPDSVELILADQVCVPKENLPPSLRNQIMRIAAFQNPEFYRAQAMRLPTYQIPRVIHCAGDFPDHIGLPRGCLDELLAILRGYKINIIIRDERNEGIPVDAVFHGALRHEQQRAVGELINHDCGVLSATTAFGKTVLAAWLIAARKTNTLVLVHRQALLNQWVERLSSFLGVPGKFIGKIGGGKRKVTGNIDVALIQSMVRKGVVNDQIGQYGHLIIDECHHIPAFSFEMIARRAKAKYVLGLSATAIRKDGHHPIIFMQCGPVRYRVDARSQMAQRPFDHKVVIKPTGFVPHGQAEDDARMEFARLCSCLAQDEKRNRLICQDVVAAVNSGRYPLVLTERTGHLERLCEMLNLELPCVIRFVGGMGKKETALAMESLGNKGCVIVATGKFIGEGFDHPPLDTLFLAMPISWRGTIAQYAGRLHRLHEGKRDVIIHDFADVDVPLLARMFNKRCKGYESIGYRISMPASAVPGWPVEVPLPVEPAWKNDYSASVLRIIHDGVDRPLAELFLQSTMVPDLQGEGEARARSSAERFLYQRLNTMPELSGLFRLNEKIPIPFDAASAMEVDFYSDVLKIAVEIDGPQHLNDRDAYRRDRKKDMLLQQNGILVLRFLTDDVSKHLDMVLDAITSAVANRKR